MILPNDETRVSRPADEAHHAAPQQLAVSLILITYQRNTDLQRTLANVLALDPPADEVILLDNDPAAAARGVIGDDSRIKYYNFGVNLGVAAGRNRAAQEASGDILIFLDDDAELRCPAAMVAIRQAFSQTPEVALVAFQIRNAFSKAIVKKEYPGKDPAYRDNPHFISYFIGCGFAIRRQVFQQIAGFDESYFYDGEELEMSWRLLKAGWQLYYLPQLVVWHYTSPAGRGVSQSTRWLARNRIITAIKHLPLPYLCAYCAVWTIFAFIQATRKRDYAAYYAGLRTLWRDRLWHRAWQYRRAHRTPRAALTWMKQYEGRLWY